MGASQREIESGALADRCLGPDAASMPRNDALYGGQADARAFKLRSAVEPLKGREEFAGVGPVEAAASGT
jgi:hypothetical protein